MRLFGVSLLTFIMLVAVGYFIGTMYPGIGSNILDKIGINRG